MRILRITVMKKREKEVSRIRSLAEKQRKLPKLEFKVHPEKMLVRVT